VRGMHHHPVGGEASLYRNGNDAVVVHDLIGHRCDSPFNTAWPGARPGGHRDDADPDAVGTPATAKPRRIRLGPRTSGARGHPRCGRACAYFTAADARESVKEVETRCWFGGGG